MRTALATATLMADAGGGEAAIGFLRERLHRLPAPTVADRFEYYSFLQVLWAQPALHNLQRALVYADSMLYLLRTTSADASMPKAMARAFFARGDILFSLGRYPESYQSYYKARQQSVRGDDPYTESNYFYRIAMVLYRQRQYEAAAALFRNSLALAAACPKDFAHFYRQQEVQSNIGLSYTRLQQYDSATYWFRRALAYIQSEGALYPERQHLIDVARGVVLGNMGEVYRLRSDNAVAGQLLRSSIAINDQKGYEPRDAARTQLSLASLYLDEKRFADVAALLRTIEKNGYLKGDAEAQVRWNEIAWKHADAVHDEAAALAYLKQYSDLKTKLLNGLLALRDNQVREQLSRLDAQQELSVVQRTAAYRRDLLWGVAGLLVLFMVFAVLVYRYWRRSKEHVDTLTELHSAIRVQKVQLEAALGQLEEEARDKDRILRMVVHDLRNPIASVAALADLLQHDTASTQEERDEYLELIGQACGNSLNLIGEILVATRGSTQVPPPMEWADLVATVKSSCDLLRFKAAEKNQSLHVRLPDEPVMMYASGERLWRVVNNLITNAIKFSPQDSTIDVTLEQADDGMLLEVHDYGIGIPEHLQGKVFDMFTEAKRPGTANEKSFGLGLAISRQIVGEHGGTISLQSREGQGTSFRVFLPFQAEVGVNGLAPQARRAATA